MSKLPFAIFLSGFLLINPAFAQDQEQQPAAQEEAVTGMGTRLTNLRRLDQSQQHRPVGQHLRSR